MINKKNSASITCKGSFTLNKNDTVKLMVSYNTRTTGIKIEKGIKCK